MRSRRAIILARLANRIATRESQFPLAMLRPCLSVTHHQSFELALGDDFSAIRTAAAVETSPHVGAIAANRAAELFPISVGDNQNAMRGRRK
jgi:hypothetical protein